MAYDSGALPQAIVAKASFSRADRLGLVTGGVAVGVLIGLFGALALGRTNAWPMTIGSPLFLLALYFAVETLQDALARNARGCTIAASLVMATLAAWPLIALMAPMSATAFWLPPVAALGSMVLLASCWTGAHGAVYRLGGQAVFVSTLVGFLGLTAMLSS
jgi:hypothetical protein